MKILKFRLLEINYISMPCGSNKNRHYSINQKWMKKWNKKFYFKWMKYWTNSTYWYFFPFSYMIGHRIYLIILTHSYGIEMLEYSNSKSKKNWSKEILGETSRILNYQNGYSVKQEFNSVVTRNCFTFVKRAHSHSVMETY